MLARFCKIESGEDLLYHNRVNTHCIGGFKQLRIF